VSVENDKSDETENREDKPAWDPVVAVVTVGVLLVVAAGAAVVMRDDGRAGEGRAPESLSASPAPEAKAPEVPSRPAVPAARPQPPASRAAQAAPVAASTPSAAPAPRSALPVTQGENAIVNYFDPDRRVVYWWQPVPDGVRRDSIPTGEHSNMTLKDYVGSRTCVECHEENHADWHGHSHRRMHELATEETVEGDFSGTGPASQIRYLAGLARFYKERGAFRMSLEREGGKRVYSVERTIGSRFFQYYVGKLLEGEEPEGLALRSVEHVLPFGWWIDKQEWVPTVHVFRLTREDDEGFDPFAPDEMSNYDSACASCHTTMASGDWMLRDGGAKRLSWYSPRSLLLHVPGYLRERQPDFLPDFRAGMTMAEIVAETHEQFKGMPIRKEAAEFGISCEACHNGCRDHVRKSSKGTSDLMPFFFPAGRSLHVEGSRTEELGRTELNRSFVCSRCHAAPRPQYASGHHTWNSTEYAEAVRGFCYAPKGGPAEGRQALTCLQCHDPHKTTGRKWPKTPEQDDQSCLDCHQQFAGAEARKAHTHHAEGSEGARCMNCHMPRINEGLQDMVRTHRIFNPTEKSMIEANQPNACNLCHLDQSIDWTIGKLREWYGEEHVYAEDALSLNYPDREGPVGRGWLTSGHSPTRLAAAAAYARRRDREALPALIELLASDDKLINRQFNQKDLDDWLGLRLKERGYQFYMNAAERRAVIDNIRDDLLTKSADKAR